MRFYIVLLATLCSEVCLCVLQSSSSRTVLVRKESEAGSSKEKISLALSPDGGFKFSDGDDVFVERSEITVRNIGGINVYNYDRPHRNKRLLLDYGGEQSDWIVTLKKKCTDHKTHVFCHEIPSKKGLEGVVCTPRGQSVGVPFVELRATLEELNHILLLDGDFQNDCIKDCDADASMGAVLEAKPSHRADEVAIEVQGTGQYVSEYQFAPPWNLDRLDKEASDAKFKFGTCAGAGQDIMTTGLPAESAASDVVDTFKAVRNGTSLAAAHVAGAAAKMVGCTNTSDVKAALIEKSKPALIGDLADSPNSFLSCVDL